MCGLMFVLSPRWCSGVHGHQFWKQVRSVRARNVFELLRCSGQYVTVTYGPYPVVATSNDSGLTLSMQCNLVLTACNDTVLRCRTQPGNGQSLTFTVAVGAGDAAQVCPVSLPESSPR